MGIANGTYYIVNKSTKHYVTVSATSGGGITANVTSTQPNYDQRWQISVKEVAAESYFIKAVDPEFYAFARSPAFSGQAVNSGLDTQRWIIKSAGAGYYNICMPNTDLVWQFASNDAASALTIAPSTGVDTQKWSINAV